MFSDTTRQIMFLSGVGMLHGVMMFLCLVGSLTNRNISPLWRTFCIGAAILFHAAFWFGLVTNEHGISMDSATIMLATIDVAAIIMRQIFCRHPKLRPN